MSLSLHRRAELSANQISGLENALASPPGAFWINLKPRVLYENDYAIDTDAVHIVQLRDLVWHFQNLGAELIQTSRQMPGLTPEVLRYNAYLVIRKPVVRAATS